MYELWDDFMNYFRCTLYFSRKFHFDRALFCVIWVSQFAPPDWGWVIAPSRDHPLESSFVNAFSHLYTAFIYSLSYYFTLLS